MIVQKRRSTKIQKAQNQRHKFQNDFWIIQSFVE